MEWSDEGIVIGARRHGESGLILELMTRAHGRHFGLVHGGRSRSRAAFLQPGNLVEAVWRARLDEHLGVFRIEPLKLRAGEFLNSPLSLYGIATLAAQLRQLPERDPHPRLYETLAHLVDNLADPDLAPTLFVLFELSLLSEFGFGLDLSRCAATGSQEDLAFVSPRTGRAVSAKAGEPWRERLLPLPGFLIGKSRANRPGAQELREAFALTGHFLERFVFAQAEGHLPEERARFLALAAPESEQSRDY